MSPSGGGLRVRDGLGRFFSTVANLAKVPQLSADSMGPQERLAFAHIFADVATTGFSLGALEKPRENRAARKRKSTGGGDFLSMFS
jgi:hypothetical protein